MERLAVKEMFEASKHFNLVYQYLVGDGDCKSFLDVWDIYGVCAHCRSMSSVLLKRSSKEYEDWCQTSDYALWLDNHSNPNFQCYAVRKIDCIQHIGKCFGNRLETVSKSRKKAPDGKSMTNGKHRLGRRARTYLRSYFSKAVKEFSRPGILTPAEQDEGAAALKRGILASFYHGLILEDKEVRHQYCPPESWCLYKRGIDMEDKDHHLHAVFEDLLVPVYAHYTKRSMLNKLLAGMTTNDLETFNSTLWLKIPKHKFHGRK